MALKAELNMHADWTIIKLFPSISSVSSYCLFKYVLLFPSYLLTRKLFSLVWRLNELNSYILWMYIFNIYFVHNDTSIKINLLEGTPNTSASTYNSLYNAVFFLSWTVPLLYISIFIKEFLLWKKRKAIEVSVTFMWLKYANMLVHKYTQMSAQYYSDEMKKNCFTVTISTCMLLVFGKSINCSYQAAMEYHTNGLWCVSYLPVCQF